MKANCSGIGANRADEFRFDLVQRIAALDAGADLRREFISLMKR